MLQAFHSFNIRRARTVAFAVTLFSGALTLPMTTERFVRSLVPKQAIVKLRCHPVLLAAARGSCATMTVLLAGLPGVVNNVANSAGESALHIAARRVDFDMVELLLRHGALASAVNHAGKRPVDVVPAYGKGKLQALIAKQLELDKAAADAAAAATNGKAWRVAYKDLQVLSSVGRGSFGEVYRARYAQGAAPRPLDDEEADARALHRVLASIGGADLVGPASELAPGTYWRRPAEAGR